MKPNKKGRTRQEQGDQRAFEQIRVGEIAEETFPVPDTQKSLLVFDRQIHVRRRNPSGSVQQHGDGGSGGAGAFNLEGWAIDLQHAILVEQRVVVARFFQIVERSRNGLGQRLVGKGERSHLRKQTSDGTAEVAARLHEHCSGINRGCSLHLASTQSLE
jgi:hypothetical protein